MAEKKTPPKTSDTGAPPPMFGTLISSKPKRTGAAGFTSTLTSVVVHALIIVGLVYATAHAAQEPAKEDAPVLIKLADETPPPPPPPPPKLDVPPPVANNTPVAKGFQTLAVPDVIPPDIPPPQVGVQIREEDFSAKGVAGGLASGKEGGKVTNDLAAAPFIVPMDVPPKMLNRDEVQEAVKRNYPPFLRDAGIGGTTTVWFFIDENGHSVQQRVNTKSGYEAFDNAALAVAKTAKFTPAMTHDKKIPVWVSIAIVFQVK